MQAGFVRCPRPARRFDVRVAASFTTRELRPSDYGAVVGLWSASEGVEVAEGDDQNGIARYLERNPGLSRVATSGDRVVGAVLCGHDGRRGVLYHLVVAPDCRGQGIGARLVQECLAALRSAGVPRALILVAHDNRDGREFWTGRGFEDISGAVPMGVDL